MKGYIGIYRYKGYNTNINRMINHQNGNGKQHATNFFIAAQLVKDKKRQTLKVQTSSITTSPTRDCRHCPMDP